MSFFYNYKFFKGLSKRMGKEKKLELKLKERFNQAMGLERDRVNWELSDCLERQWILFRDMQILNQNDI